MAASEKEVKKAVDELLALIKRYGGWMKAKEVFTKADKLDSIEMVITFKVI